MSREEHPQEIEHPYFVGRRRSVVECRQHALGEAAAGFRIMWYAPRAMVADGRHQCRRLADDPQLTRRLGLNPGDRWLRVVLDSRLRTPADASRSIFGVCICSAP